tara:strand:- start:359 stop:1291 length:933 start_codon:yes stop_codon:yes gene_type:complete
MSKILLCPKENLEADLSTKTYIVTGTTSGIGLEVVTQLARQSATIICASRNLDALKKTTENISDNTSNNKIHFMHLDLTSLKSVKSFVNNFLNKFSTLDGLVNNAAIMFGPEKKTIDGNEIQLSTNYLGHFLLSELLLPVLKNSLNSRIIHTSSVMHERGHIDLEDLNFEKRKYNKYEAYYQSKLAQILYARYQAKLLNNTSVKVVSLHPGWVQTPLIKNTLPLFVQDVLLYPFLRMSGMMNTWLGAQTTLFCLLDDSILKNSGKFYSQTGIYKDKNSRKGGWPMKCPNEEVYDDKLCEDLYNKTQLLIN